MKHFFKFLFSSNDKSEPKDSLKVEKAIAKIQKDLDEQFVKNQQNRSFSLPKFKGIDKEFIDLIFFENTIDKKSYSNKIKEILLKLNIKNGDDSNEVIEKTYNYNSNDSEASIPFLRESLMLQNSEETGIKKIQSYYPAANFIQENILLKLKSKNPDFDFEVKLFEKYLVESDLNNYAKINATFCLGEAFIKQKNMSKAGYYFNIIKNTHWNLALSTTSKYYRYIGEGYVNIGNNIEGLKWLKYGLKVYPKLGGVKRLISKLEKGN